MRKGPRVQHWVTPDDDALGWPEWERERLILCERERGLYFERYIFRLWLETYSGKNSEGSIMFACSFLILEIGLRLEGKREDGHLFGQAFHSYVAIMQFHNGADAFKNPRPVDIDKVKYCKNESLQQGRRFANFLSDAEGHSAKQRLIRSRTRWCTTAPT